MNKFFIITTEYKEIIYINIYHNGIYYTMKIV